MGYMVPTLCTMRSLGFAPERILDIGAAHGHFHGIATSVWPCASITTVEANQECRGYLDPLPGEHLYATLFCAEAKKAFCRTSLEEASGGCSLYREQMDGFSNENVLIEMVETTTLKQLFGPREFGLVKLDTQGSELDIMVGGEDLIQRADVVIVEASMMATNVGAPLIAEAIARMAARHFQVFDIVGPQNGAHTWGHRRAQVDVVFIHERNISWLTSPPITYASQQELEAQYTVAVPPYLQKG